MDFVITHPDFGIYLGTCLGMGFWSKIDPVGQPSAVTFPSESVARHHLKQCFDLNQDAISVVSVEADELGGCLRYASIEACVRAGLPAWDPEPAVQDGAPA